MVWVWLGILVISLILEGLTWDLLCFWYAIGALVALPLAIFGVPEWIQIVVMAVVSFGTMLSFRPILCRRLNCRKTATNTDALIGKQLPLLSDIAPNQPGTVKVFGVTWTAVGKAYDTTIPCGTVITVTGVEGNKLIVSVAENAPLTTESKE